MKKRGLSEVIVSLIIILLVLVAIGILWIIVSNIINSGKEEISIIPFTENINIEQVKLGSISAEIKIKRTSGKETITALNFILEGENSISSYEQLITSFNMLEIKTFTILTGIQNINKITVTPVFGKELGTPTEIKIYQKTPDNLIDMKNGVVGYWNFDNIDNEETIIKDSSGNKNDGTNHGITFTNGLIGNSGSFNGIDNYIEIPDNSLLNFGNKTDFTISMWINRENLNITRQHLLRKGFSGHTQSFFVGLENNHIISYMREYKIYDNISSPADSVLINSDITIEPKKWIFIIATFDRDGKEKIYINNNLEKEISISQIEDISNNQILEIGSGNGGTYGFFNGLMDEIIIMNRTINKNEVKTLYELQR